jgi:hypothetical protein
MVHISHSLFLRIKRKTGFFISNPEYRLLKELVQQSG